MFEFSLWLSLLCRLAECWDNFAAFMEKTEAELAIPPPKPADPEDKTIEVCLLSHCHMCKACLTWCRRLEYDGIADWKGVHLAVVCFALQCISMVSLKVIDARVQHAESNQISEHFTKLSQSDAL